MIPPRREPRSERGRAVAARKGDGERWKGGRDWRGGRARKVEREESRWKSKGRRFEVEAKLFSGLAGWLAAGKMQLRCLAAGHS